MAIARRWSLSISPAGLSIAKRSRGGSGPAHVILTDIRDGLAILRENTVRHYQSSAAMPKSCCALRSAVED
eukprot:scaffold1282_cov251-Pinguiococcus_pyrenoidosus.AAC.8